jgi:iron complex transport system substrate-binding protein
VRIVSLLPSTTEILFALGAGDDVVGVSSDCDHPEAARRRPVVSTSRLDEGLALEAIDAAVRDQLSTGDSLYRLDEDLLRSLEPDVIVTQDLCAVCAVDVSTVDDAVRSLGCSAEVVTIDPSTLVDVLESITRLGDVVGRHVEAEVMIASLRRRLDAVSSAVSGRPRPGVLVLEWTDPPFGPGHWVPDLVSAAGATAVLGNPGGVSRRLDWAEVHAAGPDVIVVAPCGFHLDDAARIGQALLTSGVLPAGVALWGIDADAAVVRPGPRLVDGVEALAALAHPGAVPERSELVRYLGTTSANTKPSRSMT